MEIENGKKYKIKSESKYFFKKYGTYHPEITIEDLAEKVFNGSWMSQVGNPTCMLYGMRAGLEKLPTDNNVYYGKINGLGELVHISEIN